MGRPSSSVDRCSNSWWVTLESGRAGTRGFQIGSLTTAESGPGNMGPGQKRARTARCLVSALLRLPTAPDSHRRHPPPAVTQNCSIWASRPARQSLRRHRSADPVTPLWKGGLGATRPLFTPLEPPSTSPPWSSYIDAGQRGRPVLLCLKLAFRPAGEGGPANPCESRPQRRAPLGGAHDAAGRGADARQQTEETRYTWRVFLHRFVAVVAQGGGGHDLTAAARSPDSPHKLPRERPSHGGRGRTISRP